MQILRPLIMLCLVAGFGSMCGSVRGEERRDGKWLVGYVTQPIENSPRNRPYLDKIDRAKLLGLLDAQWLANGQESAKGRGHATWLGQMAFAYHTPGTQWHKHRA